MSLMRWISPVLSPALCVTLALLGLPTPEAQAEEAKPECVLLSKTCVVGENEVRNINGVMVQRECWGYEYKYDCMKPGAVDYCSAIAAHPSCYQIAAGGSTEIQGRTYRCGDESIPLTTSVNLNTSHTLVDPGATVAACAKPADNSSCGVAARRCVQGTATNCQKWETDWACMAPSGNTCGELNADPNCTKVAESCFMKDNHGNCLATGYSYRCITNPGEMQTETQCTPGACVGSTCWSTASEAGTDFASVVIAQELQRQAGSSMDPNSLLLFDGAKEKCREGGLRHCCNEGTKASSNNSILSSYNTGNAIGKYAVSIGSKYEFGSSFSDKPWFQNTVGAVVGIGAAALASGVTSISAITAAYSAYTAAGSTMTATQAVSSAFSFGPMFWIAVAIMVYMALSSCNADEAILGSHRKADLSFFIGSTCSKKFAGWCVEHHRHFCSFNSVLAKLINVQGKKQIYEKSSGIQLDTAYWKFVGMKWKPIDTEYWQRKEIADSFGIRTEAWVPVQKEFWQWTDAGWVWTAPANPTTAIQTPPRPAQTPPSMPPTSSPGTPWMGKGSKPNCDGIKVDEFALIDFSKIDLSEFIDDVMKGANPPSTAEINRRITERMAGKSANDPNDATPKMPFGKSGYIPEPGIEPTPSQADIDATSDMLESVGSPQAPVIDPIGVEDVNEDV